jgi:hypothetical protein
MPLGGFLAVPVTVCKIFGSSEGEFYKHSAVFESTYFRVFPEVADEHNFI